MTPTVKARCIYGSLLSLALSHFSFTVKKTQQGLVVICVLCILDGCVCWWFVTFYENIISFYIYTLTLYRYA